MCGPGLLTGCLKDGVEETLNRQPLRQITHENPVTKEEGRIPEPRKWRPSVHKAASCTSSADLPALKASIIVMCSNYHFNLFQVSFCVSLLLFVL